MASNPAFVEHAARAPRGTDRHARAASKAAGPLLPLGTALAWALAVAIVMSTQYLVQPFVWRYWPVADVLAGWVAVLGDRVRVTVPIALAVAAAVRVSVRGATGRAAILGSAVLVGALAGEALRLAFGSGGERADDWSAVGRIAQAMLLGACASLVYATWRQSRMAAEAVSLDEVATSRERSLLVETQLQLLRHQLDPHFLFNTLATIRRLNSVPGREGLDLLRHLTGYLRSTMPRQIRASTLGEETELVTSYLAIVGIRMTGRLTVRIDVPVMLHAFPCPPLTLATLVENAVKHGITPRAEGGTIEVTALRVGDMLRLIVADTGAGIPADARRFDGGRGNRPVEPARPVTRAPWGSRRAFAVSQCAARRPGRGAIAAREGQPVSAIVAGRPPVADPGLRGRRILLHGSLWGIAATALDSVALPLADGGAIAFVRVIAWTAPGWCLVGFAIAAWIAVAGDRLLRPGFFAASLVAGAALLSGARSLVYALMGSLAPAELFPYGAETLSSYLYQTWFIAVYGGLYLLTWTLDRRHRRARHSLTRVGIVRLRTRAALADATLDIARDRIDPHLMIATMDEVERRYVADPASADRLLGCFVTFLRCAMPGIRHGRSTLAEELDLCAAHGALSGELVRGATLWSIERDARLPALRFPPFALSQVQMAASRAASAGFHGAIRVRRDAEGIAISFEGMPAPGAGWLAADRAQGLRDALAALHPRGLDFNWVNAPASRGAFVSIRLPWAEETS